MNKLATLARLAVLAFALIAGTHAADLEVGKKYFTLQLTMAQSLDSARAIAEKGVGFPSLRIVRQGEAFAVRAGFWETRSEGEKQLRDALKLYPKAYLTRSQYLPDLLLPLNESQEKAVSVGLDVKSRSENIGEHDSALPGDSIVQSGPAKTTPPENSGGLPATPGVTLPPIKTISGGCPDNKLAWRSAESIVKTDPVQARKILETLVPSCGSFTVRLVTLQLAKRILPAKDFNILLERERTAGVRSESDERLLEGFAGKSAGPDEHLLFDLAEHHRYEELRQVYQQLQKMTPSWKPSTRLQAILDSSERSVQVEQLLAAGNVGALKAFVKDGHDGLGCNDSESLIRIAEVFARAGDNSEATSLLRRMVPSCQPAGQRIAVLTAASRWLDQSDFLVLITLERVAGQRDAAAEQQLTALLAKLRSPDEQPLWELLNRGRLAELQRVINQVKVEFPLWQPPSALLKQMQTMDEGTSSTAKIAERK